MMTFRSNPQFLHHSSFVLVIGLASPSRAQGQSLIKVSFSSSPSNASRLPWMIAKDAKLFEDQGLETFNRDRATRREAIASMTRLMANLNLADRTAVNGPAVKSFYGNTHVDEVKQSVFDKDLRR